MLISSSSLPPRLHVTGDDDEADATLLQRFEDEGFDVTYLPRGNGGKAYRDKLKSLPDDLELGESYSIVGMRIFSLTVLRRRITDLQLEQHLETQRETVWINISNRSPIYLHL
jgi:hypothetical protein